MSVLKCLAAVRLSASLICADSFVIGALDEEGGPAVDGTPTQNEKWRNNSGGGWVYVSCVCVCVFLQ